MFYKTFVMNAVQSCLIAILSVKRLFFPSCGYFSGRVHDGGPAV